MKFRNKIVILVALVLAVLLAMFFMSEWNRAAFGSQGYINKGSRFGVEIGSPYLEAKEHFMSRGLIVYNPMEGQELTESNGKRCHGQEYSSDVTLDGFADDGWRRGIICMASKDGTVVRLSWHYGMFAP